MKKVEQKEQSAAHDERGARAGLPSPRRPTHLKPDNGGEQRQGGRVVANLAQMQDQRSRETEQSAKACCRRHLAEAALGQDRSHGKEQKGESRHTQKSEGQTDPCGTRMEIFNTLPGANTDRREIVLAPQTARISVPFGIHGEFQRHPHAVDHVAPGMNLGIPIVEDALTEHGGLALVLPEKRIPQVSQLQKAIRSAEEQRQDSENPSGGPGPTLTSIGSVHVNLSVPGPGNPGFAPKSTVRQADLQTRGRIAQAMPETILVIPCFNEASRLRVDVFSEYLRNDPETDFLFVDDGSEDETPGMLRSLAEEAPKRITVMSLPSNRGKAEAVRLGMKRAFESGARYAGYFDADLATPLGELPRLKAVLDASDSVEMVFGSRVQLLGRNIRRRPLRHYLGRVFATVASEMLGLAVYDTQCGAKLFRSGPEIRRIFAEPFLSSWVFDVELIARWRAGERSRNLLPADRVIYEVPVDEWVDVAGSKVRASDFARALVEIARIRRRYFGGPARRAARE